MNLKNLMAEYLHSEGYKAIPNEWGLEFRAGDNTFLYLEDEKDDQFFRLMMPGIYDVTEENQDAVLAAMNETNKGIKVVKAYTMFPDKVWLAFEILADHTPELDDIVPRAINMLRAAQSAFYEAIQNA